MKEEIYQLIVSNSNYGVVEAEDATVEESVAQIIESDKAFGKKAVLIKETEVEAVKLNFLPRISGEVVIWLRYSAPDKNSNALYAKVGTKNRKL